MTTAVLAVGALAIFIALLTLTARVRDAQPVEPSPTAYGLAAAYLFGWIVFAWILGALIGAPLP